MLKDVGFDLSNLLGAMAGVGDDDEIDQAAVAEIMSKLAATMPKDIMPDARFAVVCLWPFVA